MDTREIIDRVIDCTATESNYEDFGALFFARHFLPACQDFRQAPIHFRMMYNALSLFDSSRRGRSQRLMYNLVHRDAAKSTHFSFVFPLFIINLFGLSFFLRLERAGWEGSGMGQYNGVVEIPVTKHFIMIASETATQAERFSWNIRDELQTNIDLRRTFGNKTPSRIQSSAEEADQVWRKNLFATSDGTLVVGIGAGQRVRGINIRGDRPTIGISDDLYSIHNTKTEVTRGNLRNWYFTEFINSIDVKKGMALNIGTKVHEDSILTDQEKSDMWEGFVYPLIQQEELNRALDWCAINYEEREMKIPELSKVQELERTFTTLSWPDRHDLYSVLTAYKEAFQRGKLQHFFQEMLHRLQSPDEEQFTESMFTKTPVRFTHEQGTMVAEFLWSGVTWKGVFTGIIAIDPASSEKETADDVAITVSGYCHAFPQIDGYDAVAARTQHPRKERGEVFPMLADSSIGKMDLYEAERKHGNQTVIKKGMINEVEKFARKYHMTTAMSIWEINGQQAQYAREARKYFLKEREAKRLPYYIKVIEEVSNERKIDRIIAIMLSVIQPYRTCIINSAVATNVNICLQQLLNLGVAQHDDGCDSWSIGMKHARVTTGVDPQIAMTNNYMEDDDEFILPHWESV